MSQGDWPNRKAPRPRALDLFCGSGGAALGLMAAGFAVSGVDIEPQPDYPGELLMGDVLDLSPDDLAGYDFVWASPPCNAYTIQRRRGARRSYRRPAPDLIPPTRSLLEAYPGLYAIENVLQSPLRQDLKLELGHFAFHGNHRRRAFELGGFAVPPPALRYPYRPCTVALTGKGPYRTTNGREMKHLPPEYAAAVLGVEHIVTGNQEFRRKRINAAIPPVYAEYIGRYAIAKIEEDRYARKQEC